MQRRCLCRCHFVLRERERADGVNVCDPLAAVTACAACLNHHAVALSDRPPSDERITGDRVDVAIDFLPPKHWTGEEGG